MLNIKFVFILLFCSSSELLYAKNLLPDQNATVIYAPTININPDEQNESYPEVEKIKLLVTKEGFIEEVYFAKETPFHVRNKVKLAMKQAIFTPYRKEGVAVKSIVPYEVIFYMLGEDEYRGH
jgi:hypothetical protein